MAGGTVTASGAIIDTAPCASTARTSTVLVAPGALLHPLAVKLKLAWTVFGAVPSKLAILIQLLASAAQDASRTASG